MDQETLTTSTLEFAEIVLILYHAPKENTAF